MIEASFFDNGTFPIPCPPDSVDPVMTSKGDDVSGMTEHFIKNAGFDGAGRVTVSPLSMLTTEAMPGLFDTFS